MRDILLKQKDFIYAVAHDLIRPDSSNDNVKEILAAYHGIDATVETLVECATCVNIYKDAFKVILAYINKPVEDKPKSKK